MNFTIKVRKSYLEGTLNRIPASKSTAWPVICETAALELCKEWLFYETEVSISKDRFLHVALNFVSNASVKYLGCLLYAILQQNEVLLKLSHHTIDRIFNTKFQNTFCPSLNLPLE